MAGPGATPRRSTRATRGRRGSATAVPPTAPTPPTPPTAPTPKRKLTPRRLVAQRPAALARESYAYGSPGRSTLSVTLAAATANQPATDVIAAGVSTARDIATRRTNPSNLATVSVEADPDSDSDSDADDADSGAENLVSGAEILDSGEEILSSDQEGSTVGSQEGSTTGSPVRSRSTSPVGIQWQIPEVEIPEVQTLEAQTLGGEGEEDDDPFVGSGGGSGAITGNGTPMDEGYSRNFGTEGPIGRNVGLGSTPDPPTMAIPPISVSRTFSTRVLRRTSSPTGDASRRTRVRERRRRDSIPRLAEVIESQATDLTSRSDRAGGSQATDIAPRPGSGGRPIDIPPRPDRADGSRLTNIAPRPGGGSRPIDIAPRSRGGSQATDIATRPAASPPGDVIPRTARVGGNLPADTKPPLTTLSASLPADSPLRAALPNMTEEQLIEANRIRSEQLARGLRRRRQEEQGYRIWTESFCATIAKVLVAITLLWVAYHAFRAAPAGFRWASNQYHLQTARLKQTGTTFHRNNTSWPGSTLGGITTNQYSDIETRLTTMQNSYDSLSAQVPQLIGPNRVNYFSRGLGATIDPHLTSPTRKLTVRTRSWFGLSSYELRTPDPITAILPWSDIGDCWCAPPSGGRAQLTVLLPRKIVPTHLVIEHIPEGATLDIGAAPKDVELWVQIEDPEARMRVINAAMTVPTLAEESLLAARTMPVYGAATALDKSWIRIGRWEYNIHAANHVQSFEVPVELDHFQVAIDKVSVRVRNNWGMKDYTCLYRLKMHGLLAQKEGDRKWTDGDEGVGRLADALTDQVRQRGEELERKNYEQVEVEEELESKTDEQDEEELERN
ncbi:hypothetical protein MMC17_005408 [Xylographa soralifera]|nr:hypothetical protein [Xylographa soralifera]